MTYSSKFIYILLLLIFVACDPMVRIEYYIKNETKSKIQIECNTSNPYKKYDMDTLAAYINPNDSLKISEDIALGYAKWENERDSIDDFWYLKVMKNCIISSKNYRDRKLWDYYLKGNFKGVYVLRIHDSHFQL